MSLLDLEGLQRLLCLSQLTVSMALNPSSSSQLLIAVLLKHFFEVGKVLDAKYSM